jgi:retron-type reverse transcriptase
MLRGVPQGAPTSPFLSILALDSAVKTKEERVEYADDGVMMSDEVFEVKESEEMERAGIEYAKDKSK